MQFQLHKKTSSILQFHINITKLQIFISSHIMKYFIWLSLSLFLFVSQLFAYEPTPQELVVLDKIEMLADELTSESLENLQKPIQDIKYKQELWSRNERLASEILEIFKSILWTRMLDLISINEQEIWKIEKIEPIKLPPEPQILAPFVNTSTAELSDENFKMLMNHIEPDVANHEIIILEFTDIQCPFCQRHHNNGTLQQVTEIYPEVSYATMAFPLSFHVHAWDAAEAMNCVHRYAWYDTAMQYKQTGMDSKMNEESDIKNSLYDLNLTASLESEIEECIDSHETKNTVEQQMQLWQLMWVTGTPWNIILHVPTRKFAKISGAVPANAFDDRIQKMLAWDFSELAPPPMPIGVPPAPPPITVPKSLSQSDYDDFLKTAYVQGNKDAPVSIIEFSDVQCPFCQRHTNNETLDMVLEKYGDEVNVIYGHFPLSFHQNAQKWWEALECAWMLGGEDMFFEFKKEYYKAGGDANLWIAEDVAWELWLDVDEFMYCVDSWDFAEKVKSQMKFGQQWGVTGTPGHIVVDNETLQTLKVSWAVPAASFEYPIESLLFGVIPKPQPVSLERVFSNIEYTTTFGNVSLTWNELSDDFEKVNIQIRHQSESKYTEIANVDAWVWEHSFPVLKTWNYFLKMQWFNNAGDVWKGHIQTVKVVEAPEDAQVVKKYENNEKRSNIDQEVTIFNIDKTTGSASDILAADDDREYIGEKSTISIIDATSDSVTLSTSIALVNSSPVKEYRIYFAESSLTTSKLNLIKDVAVSPWVSSIENEVSLVLEWLSPNTEYFIVVTPINPNYYSYIPLSMITDEISVTTRE